MEEENDDEHEGVCDVESRNVTMCDAAGKRAATCDAAESRGLCVVQAACEVYLR